MRKLPRTTSTDPVSSDPTKDDVLFGRDAQSWNHGGNQRFRSIVSKHRPDYQKTEVHIKKVVIVAKIIAEVRSNGARFLKKQEGADLWFKVPHKICVDIVGHTIIRDKQQIAQRRQEQYIKKHAETEKDLLSSQRKLSQLTAPLSRISRSESANSFVERTPADISMLTSRGASLPHDLDDGRRHLNCRLQQQASKLAQYKREAEAAAHKFVTAEDLFQQQPSTMAQYKREAEAAARKVVAAEELHASIQQQKALEDELSLLRMQNSFLATSTTTMDESPVAPSAATSDPAAGVSNLPSGLLFSPIGKVRRVRSREVVMRESGAS